MDYHLDSSMALHYADSDPDEAARALLIAAEFIRAGKPLPCDLANFLAGAIEASMGKPQAYRNKAFLLELKLTSAGRRPVKTPFLNDPGERLCSYMEAGQSQNIAASQVAADFDGISESTAVRLGKKYIAQMEWSKRESDEADEERRAEGHCYPDE